MSNSKTPWKQWKRIGKPSSKQLSQYSVHYLAHLAPQPCITADEHLQRKREVRCGLPFFIVLISISPIRFGNIARIDWQYRLRRLAISLVSIGNIDCVIQQRQVFRRFSAVRDRSQHWAKRQHKSPTMTAIWPLCRSCPLDFPLPIRFGVMLKPHWHRKRQGTASPSPRITCGKTI